MISAEFLSLANLTKAQTLCIHKMTKVVMISKHKYFVLATF